VIEPANAAREAAFAEAQAEAAPIFERGKAQVEVLKMLYDEISKGGDDAFAVFMAEKLPDLLTTAVDAVSGVDIERMVVMDSGQGNAVSNAVNQRVKGAFGTLEGLSQALGIDIQQVLQTAAARSSLPPSQPVEAPTASEDRNA
jgi:flotillin